MEDDCTQDKSPSLNIIFKIKTMNPILSTRKPNAQDQPARHKPRAKQKPTQKNQHPKITIKLSKDSLKNFVFQWIP
jgi:hypothetical protein